jgi:uncharacterized membrane protein
MSSNIRSKGVIRFLKLIGFTAVLAAGVFSASAIGQRVAGFSLTPSSRALTVEAGGINAAGPIEIDVTYLNGFSGKVSETASGLPAGVTATFLAQTAQIQLLTLKVAATATGGSYPITITGTSGSLASTTSLELTILKPGFSISSSASSLAMLVGGAKTTTTVSVVSQNGFNSSVALSATGLPAGVAAEFSPASTSTKSTLTFTPSASAAPGNHTVTVTGTSGSTKSSTTIVLSIPTPSFRLLTSATTLSLRAGTSASSTISVVNPVGLSNSNVSLAISGLPEGVSASFKSSTASAVTASTLTFSATSSMAVAAGTYTATVTGTSGTAKGSATIALTISGGNFSLSASPNVFTVLAGQPGWSSSIDLTVEDQAGFSGKVGLAVSGLPAGVTSALASLNSSTTRLMFKAASTATPGTYSIKITGMSGSVTSSTNIALTIPTPNFTISSTASNLTLLVGGSPQTSTIEVANQNGFASDVDLAISGLPAGVTGTFSWTSTTSKSVLTFKAANTTSPGTFAVTVTGKSGSLVRTTALLLTIPQPAFTMSSSASSLQLIVGSSVGTKITVSGANGASSNVNLTATGLPTGVTALFSAAATSSVSELTFAAASNTIAGTYSVTVTGTSGSVSHSTNMALIIPTPGFSLSSSPSSVSVLPGGGVSSTISVAATNGFSGPVALAVSGLPAQVSSVVSKASNGGASSVLFSAASGVAPGIYELTVTGSSGELTATTTVELKVPGPLSISVTQPTYGFNVLPGSVRRIYATVSNGVTNGVNWSVSGGAALSATAGPWVDVTAPTTGSSCSINGTVGSYSITSAHQLTLTAQSQENPTKTASITINVCNPGVQLSVVPFYTTSYAGQTADVQAFVWGSVNHNVTWAITGEPSGGDGVLTDTNNQDTAFSATVAGRYTLTATSVADGSKMNTATIYVTGNSMPYDVTQSQTVPVDCTVDPAMTGRVYNVGPSQIYTTIQSVPWPTLTAGSTVRIFNEDTTGSNPTTYHEYFQVSTHATRTQPVRVCGVADSRGNLPVIDASKSTGRSDVSVDSAGYTAVGIGIPGWAGNYSGSWTGSQDLIIEGLKIQNAKPPFVYTTPAGATGTAWIAAAACVRLFSSMDVVVRGLDAYNCGNGFFSDFNANEGYAAVTNTLYEGNHLHSNGVSGSDSEHQLYIQGWNEVVQFNVVNDYQSGAGGSNLKGRGFPEIIRYNNFGDGASRQLDMVDNQDAEPFTTFEGYLGGTASSYRSRNSRDQYTADLLAAAVEAHHADYAYGNTFVNSTAGVPIHYATDHGSFEDDRIGTLWFFSNSFYEPVCDGCPNSRWYLFDTSGGGGDDFAEIEWPQIQAHNNAVWLDAPTQPIFYWNREQNQFTTFGENVINSNWGSGVLSGGDKTGWASAASPLAFQGADNSADTAGVSNLIGVSAEPFNVTTFVPNAALTDAGSPLPAAAPKLPVRFQYGPSAVQVVRDHPLTIGAMD